MKTSLIIGEKCTRKEWNEKCTIHLCTLVEEEWSCKNILRVLKVRTLAMELSEYNHNNISSNDYVCTSCKVYPVHKENSRAVSWWTKWFCPFSSLKVAMRRSIKKRMRKKRVLCSSTHSLYFEICWDNHPSLSLCNSFCILSFISSVY